MSPLLLTMFISLGAAPNGVYTYEGTVIADKGDPIDTKKTFRLSLLVQNSGGSPKLYWTVAEQGRGAWPWNSRFGIASLGRYGAFQSGQKPSLLYRHQNGQAAVAILSPIYQAPKKLGRGVSWKKNKYEYKVVDSRRVGGRKAWRIHVSSAYGRKRTVLVDQKSPLILAMRETVFIGQGQQHELQMRLIKSAKVGDEEKTMSAFEKLDGLRNKAGLAEKKQRLSLTKKQLAMLKKDLPGVATLATKSILDPIVKAASRETRVQKGRSGAIAELRRQAKAKKLAQLAFTSLRNSNIVVKTKGKVTVLHFWVYRDKPLQEPYGQVGYLDYLHRRTKKKDLQVIGVAVNQQLANPARRRTAIRSAKKLKSFMNLGYRVVADVEGETLKQIGDPRVAGARLPVFVVLDKKGKVVHYKVGFYNVRRDRGLELLQQVVNSALKSDG